MAQHTQARNHQQSTQRHAGRARFPGEHDASGYDSHHPEKDLQVDVFSENNPRENSREYALKLSGSELAAAGVVLNPNIRSAGPATPPAAIVPSSHGSSASLDAALIFLLTDCAEQPLDKYSEGESNSAAKVKQARDHEWR
jgi:hypothetical protein